MKTLIDHAFQPEIDGSIDPPPDDLCQKPGCHEPRRNHKPTCVGALTIKGEFFPCQLIPPHDGWAHGNKEAEAIWQ